MWFLMRRGLGWGLLSRLSHRLLMVMRDKNGYGCYRWTLLGRVPLYALEVYELFAFSFLSFSFRFLLSELFALLLPLSTSPLLSCLCPYSHSFHPACKLTSWHRPAPVLAGSETVAALYTPVYIDFSPSLNPTAPSSL